MSMMVGQNQYGMQQQGLWGSSQVSDPMLQAQMAMLMQLYWMQLFNIMSQALLGGLQVPGMGGGCGCGRSGYGGYGRGGYGGGYGPGGAGPVGNYPTGPSSGAGLGALDLARSQLGVREATGNNDGLPAQRYSNGRREPWCANFVAWSFRQSGNPLPGNQRSLASVQYMEDQMKRTGQFHRGQPQPGDIIFFANRGGSDRGPGRHVGIVERVENGRVHTIEGNSSNGVRRRSYALNNPRISGYGRPGGGTTAVAQNGRVPGGDVSNPSALAQRLNQELGGAFAGQGQAFVEAGMRHGVNPRLLAAIAMHETGNGTSSAVRNKNNPGGLMDPRTNWSTLQRYGSLSQGLDAMASNLRRNYLDQGLDSVAEIHRKYAPVGAANDPTGLNNHWTAGVNRFLQALA